HERVLVFSGKSVDLNHLGLSHIPGKNATYRPAFGLHLEHDPHCELSVHVEESLENADHKLHWSIVVVEQNHLILGEPLEGGLFRLHPQLVNRLLSVPGTVLVAAPGYHQRVTSFLLHYLSLLCSTVAVMD